MFCRGLYELIMFNNIYVTNFNSHFQILRVSTTKITRLDWMLEKSIQPEEELNSKMEFKKTILVCIMSLCFDSNSLTPTH